MIEHAAKVYAKIDDLGRILNIEGGYTENNIDDKSKWLLIDVGTGDRYNFCQTKYLDKDIRNSNGGCRYKYINGQIIERSDHEIEEDLRSTANATTLDKLEAQVMFTALITDTLLEV